MINQWIRAALGCTIGLLVLVAPVWYYMHRKKELRNFRIVRPGVLYRSGQLSTDSLKRIIEQYGIKTVVTFRRARTDEAAHPDIKEEEYCREFGIRHVRIGTNGAWSAGSGKHSLKERVRRFREVVENGDNYPVLVHCLAGVHRTGAYCAVYRMEFEEWSAPQAVAELIDHGYHQVKHHHDLYQYLMGYPAEKAQRDSCPCCDHDHDSPH